MKHETVLVVQIVKALNVSPYALSGSDIDSYVALIHTLFTVQDLYSLKIVDINRELCLRLDKSTSLIHVNMFKN